MAAAAKKTAADQLLSRFRLKESRMQRTEFVNTMWSASVEASVSFEDVLKPEFWGHVAGPKGLKIGDEIVVTPDNGAWYARLYVRDVGRVWAKVEVLLRKDFEAAEAAGNESAAPGFKVEWQGVANKHVVIRESDGAIISKGHKSKAEATIAMIEHARQAK